MPVQMQPGSIDFSMLAKLPLLYQQGQQYARDNQLRSALAGAINPDGTFDFSKAAAIVSRIDSVKGLDLASQFQKTNEPDWEVNPVTGEIWNKKNPTQTIGVGNPITPAPIPTSTSAPQPSVPTGLTPKGQMEFQNQYAKNAADAASKEQKKGEINSNLQAGINQMWAGVQGFDPTTFENALGPIQGSEPDTLVNSTLAGAAKVGGSLLNAFQGGRGTTSEVRDFVKSNAAAFGQALKPLIRDKGEGVFGVQDQKELDKIVGDLASASSKEEFQRRLSASIDSINANYGLDLKKPWETKDQSRFTNSPGSANPPGNAIPVQTYDVSPSGEITPNQAALSVPPVPGAANGPVVQGPGAAPPTPPARALNALKAYANNPDARAAFDEIYGPGAAEFYLQKSR